MRFGILKNNQKAEAGDCARRLQQAIEKVGDSWFMLDECPEPADVYVSIGGDGTFLQAAAMAIEPGIPVLGINLGTLGMLTEFDVENVYLLISRLKSGEYRLDTRTVLDIKVLNKSTGETAFHQKAINDCVVTQAELAGVAYIQTKINGSTAETYPCDGVIVSTQTGSTAYSYSAGGPIVMPGCDVLVVTPKCPHFVSDRSIVTGASSEITLEPVKYREGLVVAVDGHVKHTLAKDEYVLVTSAEEKLKILRMDPPDFFVALKHKMQIRQI